MSGADRCECDFDLEFHRERVRATERRNKRARTRALVRLAHRYPQEYEALRLEALRTDPVDSPIRVRP